MRPRKVLSTTPVFVVIVGHGFEGGPSPVPGKGSGIHSGGGWSRPTFGSTERRGIKWWFQSSRIQSKQREASFRQRMLSLRSSEQLTRFSQNDIIRFSDKVLTCYHSFNMAKRSRSEDKDSLHILQSICTGAVPDGPVMDDRNTSIGPLIDKTEVPNEVLLPEPVPSDLYKHGVEAWVEVPHGALVHHQDRCKIWDDGGLTTAHSSAEGAVGCALDALAVGIAATHIQIRVVVHPMTMKRLRVVEGTNGVPSRVNPVVELSGMVVFDVKQV
uniref:Uncharacterized protein n=1 Tax=Leersia perrieri TaxID=77586 RepID=A0A0D9Y1F5_9ORYZ